MKRVSKTSSIILKWITLTALVFCSVWFMKDMWEKFEAQDTNFRLYQELRTVQPITTLCLSPYAKASVLKKYNVSLEKLNYINQIDNITISWDQFQKEAFYKIGNEFELYFGDDTFKTNFDILIGK